jgi:serine/threonine protein kinase
MTPVVSEIHASTSSLPAGTQLNGIYEIDAPIASGGMGEVYKGHEIQSGDCVAIKVIRSDMARDEVFLALFRKEASALNRLHHEVIVRYVVFSRDPIIQRHYLAMEFVEGESLSEILKRGPLAVEQVHALQKRLASGLQAAHAKNIVHRDMSPANVIVPGGDVTQSRIIDFGIARSNRVGDTTLISGGFAGKPGYVSPEQLGMFDGNVTGRSDIYSLGLVLAQCLLGEPIDMGKSQVAVIEKRKYVPNLSEIDPRMRPLIERMLQPDPANRLASMAEVASWPFETALAERTIVAPRVSRAQASEHGPGNRPAVGQAESFEPSALSSRIEPGAASRKREISWRIPTIAGLALSVMGFLVWTQIVPHKPVSAPPLDNVIHQGDENKSKSGSERKEGSVVVPSKIAEFIRQFEGGDCFLAVPITVSAQAAEIEGYGLDRNQFDAFYAAFKLANGFEAKIDVHKVTKAQCPVLAFIRPFLASAASPQNLDLRSGTLRSGDTLQATLRTGAVSNSVLIVDDEGIVHDVSKQLRPSAKGREFVMRLQTAHLPHTWLLLAVASPQQIGSLGSAEPVAAKDFFPSLGAEVKQLAQLPSVSLRYVKIN